MAGGSGVDRVYAPFTDEQVKALNGFQFGPFHPFTCPREHVTVRRGGGVIDVGETEDRYSIAIFGPSISLVALNDGWHCPSCDYTQDWAHGMMADEARWGPLAESILSIAEAGDEVQQA
jgi:hypothetical protein